MEKYTLKERFLYWFDSHLAKGTISMIRMLTVSILVIILIISLFSYFLNFHEENNFFYALWDSFASTINAWVLYSSDGSPGYIILMAVSAIVGILFTSLLIGILNSAIEKKLNEIQYGNSKIIEENHTVIIGFNPGSYQLINQLCLSSGEQKNCIVVAGDTEKDVMHQLIGDNINIPKNVKIKCRNINIFDPNDLKCCSLASSKSIIINETDDDSTIKILLAINALLRENPQSKTKIIASIKDDNKNIAAATASNNKVILINAKTFVARLIAYSCMQLYISNVFSELFGYLNAELYIKSYPSLINKTFLEASLSLVADTPVGIIENDKIILNPSENYKIKSNSKLLVFSEDKKESIVSDKYNILKKETLTNDPQNNNDCNIAVIGYNDSFPIIVNVLKVYHKTIYVAGIEDISVLKKYQDNNLIDYIIDQDINDIKTLENLVDKCTQVIILSNDKLDENNADMEAINILLNLRNIKFRLNKSFSIIVEMKLESNKYLASNNDETDFIVSSDMISMILAQIAEEPMLKSVFRELLSETGNGLYLKPVTNFINPNKEVSVAKVRLATLKNNCVFLGYIKQNSKTIISNPHLDTKIKFNKKDRLIVFSEK